MTESATCTHEGCNCIVPKERAAKGDKFCCDSCAKHGGAAGHVAHACGCGHTGCAKGNCRRRKHGTQAIAVGLSEARRAGKKVLQALHVPHRVISSLSFEVLDLALVLFGRRA